jgi:hypothetical protein
VAEAVPDPPSNAEWLVQHAVNCFLERHVAGSPGGDACSEDPLAEFLAEVGVLALAALFRACSSRGGPA